VRAITALRIATVPFRKALACPSRRARLRVEGLEDRSNPTTINVTATTSPTPTDNNYTRIQQAVDAAVAGDVIQLSGTFDFSEPNAAASWARGDDGVSGDRPGFPGFTDDYSVYVSEKAGITITAASLGAATVKGPGDVPQIDLDGFLYFDGLGYQGWTISNLVIQDFDMSIGMFGNSETDNTYGNTVITNNQIRIATDLNGVTAPNDTLQNVGILLGVGRNQTVSNNQIDIPGNGLSSSTASEGDLDSDPQKFATTVGIQTVNTAGDLMNGLSITDNKIRVLNAQTAFPERVVGVWDNSTADHSNITISNNQFLNLDPLNDPSLNREQAFWITSHSSTAGTTVTYDHNTVSGASLAFRYVSGYDFASDAANAPVRFTNNTVTDVVGGFLVQGNGQAYLSGNRITGTGPSGGGAGILVRPGSQTNLDAAIGANTITGFATGILSQGKVRVDGANITGNGVGIEADTGRLMVQNTDLRNNSTAGLQVRNGAIVDAGQLLTATHTPSDYSRLGISSGHNNFAGGYSAAGAQAIVDDNTGPGYSGRGPGGVPLDLQAQNNFWEHLNAAYIESVVFHDFDDPNLGYVDYSSATTETDLSVTARFVTAPAFVGQHLTLLVKVTNFGPSNAPNSQLTANVPAGTTFLSVATDTGTASQAAGLVTANLGTLPSGATAVVRIVVQPTVAGPIASTATAATTGTDAEPVNNTAVANGTANNSQGGIVAVALSLGTIVIVGDASPNAIQVIPGPVANQFVVLGLGGTQVKFKGGTGTSATVSGVTTGVSANLAGGDDTFIVDGSGQNAPLSLRGGVGSTMTLGNDTLYALHVTATGGLSGIGGGGNGAGTVTESTFRTNLTWVGAGGNDNLKIADTTVVGSLVANGGAGLDGLDIAGLVVNKNLTWAGGPDTDVLNLANARVIGNTVLSASTGSDTATVSGGTFGGFTWTGGTGQNSLNVSDSTFAKAFAARGGAADDTVTVIRSSFGSSTTFDGGTNADTLDAGTQSNPIGSARGNSFAKPPVVVRFEIKLS
jgi:uncharacterized repeat protein (TIGR01451 family)